MITMLNNAKQDLRSALDRVTDDQSRDMIFDAIEKIDECLKRYPTMGGM